MADISELAEEIRDMKKEKELDTAIRIETEAKWYKRIWYLISNPFLYIVKGKWRL